MQFYSILCNASYELSLLPRARLLEQEALSEFQRHFAMCFREMKLDGKQFQKFPYRLSFSLLACFLLLADSYKSDFFLESQISPEHDKTSRRQKGMKSRFISRRLHSHQFFARNILIPNLTLAQNIIIHQSDSSTKTSSSINLTFIQNIFIAQSDSSLKAQNNAILREAR